MIMVVCLQIGIFLNVKSSVRPDKRIFVAQVAFNFQRMVPAHYKCNITTLK